MERVLYVHVGFCPDVSYFSSRQERIRLPFFEIEELGVIPLISAVGVQLCKCSLLLCGNVLRFSSSSFNILVHAVPAACRFNFCMMLLLNPGAFFPLQNLRMRLPVFCKTWDKSLIYCTLAGAFLDFLPLLTTWGAWDALSCTSLPLASRLSLFQAPLFGFFVVLWIDNFFILSFLHL